MVAADAKIDDFMIVPHSLPARREAGPTAQTARLTHLYSQRRGTDRRRMLGAVVGKALEPLRKGLVSFKCWSRCNNPSLRKAALSLGGFLLQLVKVTSFPSFGPSF
jgi:hypothetical protein